MIKCVQLCAATALVLAAGTAQAGAQTFDTVGTRAAGMGGAFVAVADDASAAYWNPAGFAAGSFFTLVIDRTSARVEPDSTGGGGSRSGLLLALGAPAVGLSYYRLRNSVIVTPGSEAGNRNAPGTGEVRVDALVTHQAGATLVQSIVDGVAVGATLKLVRGMATSDVVPDAGRDALLEDTGDRSGRGRTTFDADLGIMATFGAIKAGLTIRDLTQPTFSASNGQALRLERQARAGLSVAPLSGWIVDADLDLMTTAGPLGNVRDFAIGTEGHAAKRLFVRTGIRVNTAGSGAGRSPSVSGGASYAVTAGFLVDAQVTAGADNGPHGWGIGGRFVY